MQYMLGHVINKMFICCNCVHPGFDIRTLTTTNSTFVGIKTGKLVFRLNPRSRVFEKLTGSQPVKKFPTFYGTRRFITAFTNARHLSLS